MSDRKKWIETLDQLWLKNFRVCGYYRRATGSLNDSTLRNILVKYSSKRAQFAFELSQQMKILGAKPPAYAPNLNTTGTTISLNLTEENTDRILEKSINTEKDCLMEYTRALSLINDGTTREILIRHKAMISTIIRDLQKLNALQPFNNDNEILASNKNQQL